METPTNEQLEASVTKSALTETERRYVKKLKEAIRHERSVKLMTITEFCQQYRICPRTVWNWVRKGRLKAARDAGGRIYRLVDPGWPQLDDSSHPELVMRLGVLKPGQVAALLGVRPSTVRKMASTGRLKSIRVGTQRRFSVAEVQRALAVRALGRRPKNRKEVSEGVVRWARWKLDHPGASAPNWPIEP